MRIKKVLSLFICFIVLPISLYAQGDIPLGTWRTHVSFQNTFLLEPAGDQLFCASEQGLFSYDLNENSTRIYSKVNELSDVGVTALHYDDSRNLVLIGYANGNIDLLYEDEIVNVRLVLNARFNQKRINYIFTNNNLAYFCADFGVMVFDLQREEIKETYAALSREGEDIAIYDGLIWNDSIYLASEEGLLSAALADNINKQDFNKWNLILPAGNSALKHLSLFNEALYFTYENQGLQRYNGNDFQQIGLIDLAFFGLSSSQEGLLISSTDKIYTYNGTLDSLTNSFISAPQQTWQPNANNIYVADRQNGLLLIEGNIATNLSPRGLNIDEVASLSDAGNRVIAFPPAFNASRNPLNNAANFSVFGNEGWQTFNNQTTANLPAFNDAVGTTFDPFTNILYIAGHDNQIIAWNLADDSFTPLEDTPFIQPGFQGNLTGLSIDALGRLWAIIYGVGSERRSVYVFDGDNWRSFTFDENVTRFPIEIIADDFGNQWIRLSSGLMVVDGTGEYVILNEGSAVNALPNSQVLSIANDKESRVWVGTARGVIEFFSSDITTLKNENVSSTPIFESRQLLRDEQVTSIAIDGGNRKWLGSRNGLWLFNESGTALIAFYDENNSPLFSSEIVDIGIEDNTGEVFVLTSNGVLSLRNDATEGAAGFDQVKVFPNPVREDFNGLVSISGLTFNADVKITDIHGRLIWETTANGGTATWDARNYNGVKAKTGIYLIYTASTDGSLAFQGKIAVIE